MTNHGDHWGTVFADVRAFARGIPDVIRRSRLIAEIPAPDGTVVDGMPVERFLMFGDDRSAIEIVSLIACNDARPAKLFHATWPRVARGYAHQVVVEAVEAWADGMQAQIVGTIGDVRITYFDPLYPLNRDRYTVGNVAVVELAALAYQARPARDAPIDLAELPDDHPLITAEEGAGLDLSTVAALVPAGTPDPDDFAFQMTVESVEPLRLAAGGAEGASLLRLDGPVARQNGVDVSVPLLVAPHCWEGETMPAPGDTVQGALWLQGSLPPAPALV